MKDLDKIKELVATCDSTNIELAIALGVNMEGVSDKLLEEIVISFMVNNFKAIKDGMKVYNIPIYKSVIVKDIGDIWKESKSKDYTSFNGLRSFYKAVMSSYLSL